MLLTHTLEYQRKKGERRRALPANSHTTFRRAPKGESTQRTVLATYQRPGRGTPEQEHPATALARNIFPHRGRVPGAQSPTLRGRTQYTPVSLHCTHRPWLPAAKVEDPSWSLHRSSPRLSRRNGTRRHGAPSTTLALPPLLPSPTPQLAGQRQAAPNPFGFSLRAPKRTGLGSRELPALSQPGDGDLG